MQDPSAFLVDAGNFDADAVDNTDAGFEPDGGVDPEPDGGVITCTDDINEEDDTEATATALTGESTAIACPNDNDVWRVAAAAGCNFQLTINNTAVDAELRGPDGAVVLGEAGAWRVPFTVPGNYFLTVATDARAAYTVTLQQSCTADLTCPTNDLWEVNNTSGEAVATTLSATYNGIVCGDDFDFFTLPVTPGCLAVSSAAFTHANGDIDVEFFAPDGRSFAQARSSDDDELLVRLLRAPGYTQRLALFEGSAGVASSYALTTQERCASDLQCPADDPFEPNNDLSNAVLLNNDDDGALGIICDLSSDLFSVFPVSGCQLQLELVSDLQQADLDLYLLNSVGEEVIRSASGVIGTESINHTPSSSAQLFVQVARYAGVEPPPNALPTYLLTIDTVCP